MLLLDKPPGLTSARAVARVKRLLPKKTKIGHTGTLDPLASGLLVLMIGRATRLSRYVTGMDKTYTATARFGAVSDTLDAEGEVSELPPVPIDESSVRAALPKFTGELDQIPPMASAVKVGGRRLYDLHRSGEQVERASRRVSVHTLHLTSFDETARTAEFELACTSGTYVRTLVADLFTALDSGAYLTALRRTSVGPLQLSSATPLAELTDYTSLENHIIPKNVAVSYLPVVELGDELREVVRNGGKLPVDLVGEFRVEDGCGELLAVYRGDGEVARAEVVLWQG